MKMCLKVQHSGGSVKYNFSAKCITPPLISKEIWARNSRANSESTTRKAKVLIKENQLFLWNFYKLSMTGSFEWKNLKLGNRSASTRSSARAMKFSGYTVSVVNMLIGKIDIRQDRLGSGSLNLEKSSVVRNTIQCYQQRGGHSWQSIPQLLYDHCIETGITSVISRCIFLTLIQNNVSEAPLILWARHNLFVGQWPMDTRLFPEQAWNEILWLPDKRGRISKINGSTVVPEK